MTNAATVVSEACGHQGRMVWKDISRRGAGAQRWTIERTDSLLRDGHTIVLEPIDHQPSTTNLSGTLQGAGGVGGLLAEIQNREPYLASFDANGNVTEFVSTNGVTVAYYEYSPFGEIVVQSGNSAASFTHRFSTKPWCGVTGLIEYEMRKYEPGMGRWRSRDPIGERGGVLLYGYVSNDPLSQIDPFGLTNEPGDYPPDPGWGHYPALNSPPQNQNGLGTCGPDITAAVNATLADIVQVFAGWNKGQRCRACLTLYFDIFFGWDIIPLYRLGYHKTSGWPVTGTGAGSYTVQFNGKCYHASAVNYAMWGKVNSLCRSTFPVDTSSVPGNQPWTLPCALSAVGGIKLFHGYAQVVEAQAFTVYGYSGFLPSIPPLPWIGPPGGLTLNSNLVGPSQPYEWRWRPYQNPNVK